MHIHNSSVMWCVAEEWKWWKWCKCGQFMPWKGVKLLHTSWLEEASAQVLPQTSRGFQSSHWLSFLFFPDSLGPKFSIWTIQIIYWDNIPQSSKFHILNIHRFWDIWRSYICNTNCSTFTHVKTVLRNKHGIVIHVCSFYICKWQMTP